MARAILLVLQALFRRRLFWLPAALVSLTLLPGLIALRSGRDDARLILLIGVIHVAVVVPGMLAMHLKNCLATPATRLVPGLGRAHALAAALVLAPVVAAAATAGAAAGMEPPVATALAALLVVCTFGGPWVLPYGLAVLGFLPLVLGTAFYALAGGRWSSLLQWVQPWHLWASAALFLGLLAGMLWRAAGLHPERLEYRTQPYMDFNDPTRAACESPVERLVSHLLRGMGRNQVPRGQRLHDASARDRVRHWRRGMSEYSPLVSGLTMGLITAVVGLVIRESESQRAVLTFYLFLFPAMRYLQIHRRRDQIQLEALLPLSKEARWREMDRAVLLDFLAQWFWYALCVVLVRAAGVWGGVPWAQLVSSLILSLGVLGLAAGLSPLFLRIRSHQAAYIVHMTLVSLVGIALWITGQIWLEGRPHPGWLGLTTVPALLGWAFYRWGRVDRRDRDLI